MHPNDRCSQIPYFEDEEIEGLERRAKDPVTGKDIKVPDNISYNEWRKSVDEKYGEGTFNKYQRMTRNEKYDKEQYNRYKNVIGKKNLLSTFEKYQEMKYNNSNEYNLLKGFYKSSIENSFPSDMTYEIYKSNLTTNKWEAVGFNPNYVENHKKHLKEFNNITFEEYEKRAKALLNSKDDGNIVSFIGDDSTRFKYNILKNEFACARGNGVTQTYYKPTGKMNYWKGQIEKYGKK